MMKCNALKSLLLAILIVNFCAIFPVFSQSNNIFEKNIIREITFSMMGSDSVMIVKGEFKSLQVADITIAEGSDNSFRISIPKSLPDPQFFPSLVAPLEYGINDPVNTIKITETTIEGADGVPDVAAILDVDAKKKFNIEILAPIETEELKILLKEDGLAVQTATIAQEGEQARMEQMEIEQKTQEAQAKARESVAGLLKQYRKPSIMQVSILNASGYPKRAYGLSVYLGKLKKEFIEESLGMKMEIINISNADNMNHLSSTIYFRQNYLKSALFLAKLIKGDQKVVPIADQESKQGVDIEIYLGKDYK